MSLLAFRSLILAVLLSSCGKENPDQVNEISRKPKPSSRAIDPIVHIVSKIESGVAPEDLASHIDARVLDAIRERTNSGNAWNTLDDMVAAVSHIAKHARPKDADYLFKLAKMTPGGLLVCRLASWEKLLEEKHYRQLAQEATSQDPQTIITSLEILAACDSRNARSIVEGLSSKLLESEYVDVIKVQLRALGAHRLWSKTSDVFQVVEEEDGDGLLTACIIALGEMNQVRWGELPRQGHLEDHKMAISGLVGALKAEPWIEACESFLVIATKQQLITYLNQTAATHFKNRHELVLTAWNERFAGGPGPLVHRAFLDSPDDDLVAEILYSSPYRLGPQKLGPLLFRKDIATVKKSEDTFEKFSLAELAARRLEKEVRNRKLEIPSDKEARAALVRKWRFWLKSQ